MKRFIFAILLSLSAFGCTNTTQGGQPNTAQNFFTPSRAFILIDAIQVAIDAEKALELDEAIAALGHPASPEEQAVIKDKLIKVWQPVDAGYETLKVAAVQWREQLNRPEFDPLLLGQAIRQAFCNFAYLIIDKPKILVILKQNLC